MKEVYIVIENGLVQKVYADNDVSVTVIDLDSTEDDYVNMAQEEIDILEKKYDNQGCDYFDPEALEEEE